MGDEDSESNIEDLVTEFSKLASKKGETAVTRPHTGYAKHVKGRKEVSKYVGDDTIGDFQARQIGATIMEQYHRKMHKVTGETEYHEDVDYWMSIAEQTLGDNYATFLERIADGDIESAVDMVKDASGQQHYSLKVRGLAQKVTTLSPENRKEWADKIGAIIEKHTPDGEELKIDYAKLQEHPETALTYFRQLRDLQKPLKAPKPSGKGEGKTLKSKKPYGDTTKQYRATGS